MAREVVRRPARARQDLGHLRERIGDLDEQREIGGAAADRLDEVEAAAERDVRGGAPLARAGPRAGVDQARHELVEAVAARRRQLQVAAARPQRAQARERLARRRRSPSLARSPSAASSSSVPSHTGAAGFGSPRRRRTRSRNGASRSRAPRRARRRTPASRRSPCCARRSPGRRRTTGSRASAGRRGTAGDARGAAGTRTRRASSSATARASSRFAASISSTASVGRCRRLGVAPAADELERLRDELDLADAAGAELDVVGELAPRHLGADLRVQVRAPRRCAVVEILPEHERPDDPLEAVGHARIAAGDDARLDPRVALPLAALGDEVLLERVEARRERPESPHGRRRMSTRNTKPSAVTSASVRMIRWPSRTKNSWFESARGPAVSPSSG